MAGLTDLAGDERAARMVLSLLVEPNDRVTGRLLARLGAVGTLWLAEHDSAVMGLSAVDAHVWRGHFDVPAVKDIASRLDQVERSGVRALIPGDADWPAALDDLGVGAPYVLWARGASSFLARPVQDFITITGARASTSYGDHVARELAASMAADERVVVAGGAYGIDGAAHQAALATGGDTIAILANGVDRPYPAGHRDLLERVADVGLLVSEVPPGAVPTRNRFIARARLMAALSSATVVVEAGSRSGSLVVARHAFELGRGVGAAPGPVTSAASVGSHRLLRDGTASLVANTSDLARLAERGTGHRVPVPRAQIKADRLRAATPTPSHTL